MQTRCPVSDCPAVDRLAASARAGALPLALGVAVGATSRILKPCACNSQEGREPTYGDSDLAGKYERSINCPQLNIRSALLQHQKPGGGSVCWLLGGGVEVAHVLQQQLEAADRMERVWVLVAERIAPPFQRLAQQWLSGGEVALGNKQRAEVHGGGERLRMAIAECRTPPLQHLAQQRLSGGEIALILT
eukprot:scaffold38314_cov61-Phaeocystis_antarctica.AAC.2